MARNGSDIDGELTPSASNRDKTEFVDFVALYNNPNQFVQILCFSFSQKVKLKWDLSKLLEGKLLTTKTQVTIIISSKQLLNILFKVL